MNTFQIKTDKRSQMVDLTHEVQQIVSTAGTGRGSVVVYVPHTTAGITINENADPDVVHDLLEQLEVMVPPEQPFYRHAEGNSAAHVKATMTGSSVTILIEDGKLVLGRWQGIWFCEFDGPRTRRVMVQVNAGPGSGV